MTKSEMNTRQTVTRAVLALLCLYILGVSIAMIGKTAVFWLFSLYTLICICALYTLCKVVTMDVEKIPRWLIGLQAFMATLLLWPQPLGYLADYIGVKCANLLGGVVRCSESITFSSVEVGAALLAPMLLIAVLTYLRKK